MLYKNNFKKIKIKFVILVSKMLILILILTQIIYLNDNILENNPDKDLKLNYT